MVAVADQNSGQLFLFFVTGGHSSLDVIEEDFSVATVKGVNARSGWTPSTAFETEKLSVKTVTSQRPQRPSDGTFTPLIQDQIGFAHFQLTGTQTPASIVHVHHL